jgi:hypothetical protein
VQFPSAKLHFPFYLATSGPLPEGRADTAWGLPVNFLAPSVIITIIMIIIITMQCFALLSPVFSSLSLCPSLYLSMAVP